MDDRTEKTPDISATNNTGKQSTFRRFLTSFDRRFQKTQTSPLPLDSKTHDLKVQAEVEQEIIRNSGIAQFIEEELAKRNLKPPEFENMGSSRFWGTNERFSHKTLEILRDFDFNDNYLIGVGVPNIFTLLDGYKTGTAPRGIVLVNPDPIVADQARIFIQGLRQGVLTSFMTLDDIKAGGSSYRPDPEFANLSWGEYIDRAALNGREVVITDAVLERHFPLLERLAREGNIVVIQQDLFKPELLQILSGLSGIKEANNLIYLSNVSDWIYRAHYRKHRAGEDNAFNSGGPQLPPLDISNMFNMYSNLALLTPHVPYKNYFAYSRQALERRRVTISPQIPTFQEKDLEPG